MCFGEEGSLYIKGDFLLETPEQIRQRHAEWNNSSFKVESDGSFSDREVIDYRDYYQPRKLARMDDAGYWESTDGGETWALQTEYAFNDLRLSFEDIHNDFLLTSNQEYFEGLDGT